MKWLHWSPEPRLQLCNFALLHQRHRPLLRGQMWLNRQLKRPWYSLSDNGRDDGDDDVVAAKDHRLLHHLNSSWYILHACEYFQKLELAPSYKVNKAFQPFSRDCSLDKAQTCSSYLSVSCGQQQNCYSLLSDFLDPNSLQWPFVISEIVAIFVLYKCVTRSA